jgi:hypothetical protein
LHVNKYIKINVRKQTALALLKNPVCPLATFFFSTHYSFKVHVGNATLRENAANVGCVAQHTNFPLLMFSTADLQKTRAWEFLYQW